MGCYYDKAIDQMVIMVEVFELSDQNDGLIWGILGREKRE